MNPITNICFLLLMLVTSSCKTQNELVVNESKMTHENTLIKGNFSSFEIDDFGNFYLLKNNNTLQKFDENYNLLFEYSSYRQGTISTIDVSNPQKILIYLSEYQHIVFLDNTLSEIKTLNLEALGFWQVNSIALSADNNIWIYDPTIHQLIKINDQGKVILKSNELIGLNIRDNTVTKIMVDNLNVFVASELQIITFDQFAQYTKAIDLEYEKIQLYNKQWLFLFENTISVEEVETSFSIDANQRLYESKNPIKDFNLSNSGELFVLDNNGLMKIKI